LNWVARLTDILPIFQLYPLLWYIERLATIERNGFLQIRSEHLQLTSPTPGLSNPCKLRFKSNITGIFKIDICRVVGDTSGFKTDNKLVVIAESTTTDLKAENDDITGF